MPEKVSFYYLKSPQIDGKLRLACKLVSTAYNHGHKVFVSIPSENNCRVFNDRLWTFSWSSFIPHTLLIRSRQIDLDKYPVVIGHIEPPEWYNDVLVSLHDDTPQFFEQFNIIVEPVDASEPDIRLANNRYQFYVSSLGFEPNKYYI